MWRLMHLSRPQITLQIIGIARAGRKIFAILLLRRLYNCRLVEAKDWIEGLMDSTAMQ